MTERPDPALQPVWEVKDRLWKEVEHLPLREAIRERMCRAQEAARVFESGKLHSPKTKASS